MAVQGDPEVTENAERRQLRGICFIFYIIVLEVVGIGCLGLAIFSLSFETLTKLRIWEMFDSTMDNLPPILAIIASVLTILSPIVGIIGFIKRHQTIIILFCSFITITALLWFGIGAWCVSLQSLVISNVSIIFERLKRDGYDDSSDALQFLKDLREYMPRLSTRLNYLCCQSTIDSALPECATHCGINYQDLLQTIIFPSLYAVFFGAGCMCLLSVLCACLVSCHLDDVKPVL